MDPDLVEVAAAVKSLAAGVDQEEGDVVLAPTEI